MNRWKFLTGLLGVGVLAKTQRYEAYTEPDWKQCDVPGNELSRIATPEGCGQRMRMKLAKNNQCPVCGTMAAPYNNPDKGGMFCVGMNGPAPCGPLSRVTRCQRCNVAFWQNEA